MTEAELVVRWRAPGVHRVLAVLPEAAWVWSLAGDAEPWTGRAGSFRSDVLEVELAAARDLGERVAHEPAPADGQLSLTVTGRGTTARVPAGSRLADAVGAAFGALLDRAAAAPVSAFAVGPSAQPLPAGAPLAALAFTALGPEAVELTLDPDGVHGQVPDAGWLALPTVRMGLVDAATTLLDGVHAPATLAPGVVAGWAVPVPVGTSPVLLRVTGSVRLVGPWPDGLPEQAFELESRVA